MKNVKKGIKILILILLFNIICVTKTFCVNIEDFNFKELEYTENYKKYLDLSEEEKMNVMVPSKYDLGNNSSTNSALVANQYISLNNFMSYLRASNYSTESKFFLKDLIAPNLKIRNQKQTHFCWAYAAMSSLETNLALKDLARNNAGKVYDFSERHMVYSKSSSFLDGQKNKYGLSIDASTGVHDFTVSTSYFTSGIGAINEEDMPFENNEDKIDISEIQNKTVQTTVDDVIYFDVIEKTSNASEAELENLQKQIKEHISTSGSIAASIYMPNAKDAAEYEKYFKESTAAIYCDSEITKFPNHGVSLVGWDDTYSKDNFSTKPKADGAWIVRNSYGEYLEEYTYEELKELIASTLQRPVSEITDEIVTTVVNELLSRDTKYEYDSQNKILRYGKMANDGFYYISYYDEYVYCFLMGIVNAENKKTYDNIYQHDEVGATAFIQTTANEIYAANTFQRTKNTPEYLTSIGIHTAKGAQTYEVYVNPNDSEKTLNKLQKIELIEGEDVSLTSGYHTINFETPLELTGNSFSVVVKLTSPTGATVYIESNKDDKNVESNKDESYVGLFDAESNDISWVDIGDQSNETTFYGNLGIKAITVNDNEGNKPSPSTDEKTKGSDYSGATAKLNDMVLNTNTQKFSIKISISGIKVENLCDKYEHYFYLSSNANATNIPDNKWSKAGKFEKQADGTYTLSFEATDLNQIEDLTDDNMYIYIKELATKGNETITTISQPIQMRINPSEYNIKALKQQTEATNKDSTTSPTILPHTGTKMMLTILLIALAIGMFFFKKYKSLNDIK